RCMSRESITAAHGDRPSVEGCLFGYQQDRKCGKQCRYPSSIWEESRRASGPINKILNSNEPWDTKGARLSLQITGVCTRVLFGVVNGTVHVATLALRHTAWVNPTYW